MSYPPHAYDFIQYRPGRRGLYESNYLKANAPDGQRAFWLKYNVLAPFDAARPATAELWAILFDRARPPRALKQTFPMSNVQTSNDALCFESANSLLTPTNARGWLANRDGAAEWDLRLDSTAPPFFHLPSARFYTLGFPKKKILTPAPRVFFDGTLSVAGETVEVKRWLGLRGHNWGSEHAHSYAYGNCQQFAQAATALLDGFTARIRLGPVVSPWLSMALVRIAGGELKFNQPSRWLTRSAVVAFPRWETTLSNAAYALHLEWDAPPETFVGLRYLHPNGAVSYCYNTKFAAVRAELTPRAAGPRTVLTGQAAELEFLFSEPLAGIPLHGEETL